MFQKKLEQNIFCEEIDHFLLEKIKEYRHRLPLPLSFTDRHLLLSFVRKILNDELGNSDMENIPHHLKITCDLFAFISIYHQENLLVCLAKKELSLFDSLKSAALKAREYLSNTKTLISMNEIWIKIDVLFDQQKFKISELNNAKEVFEVGLHSLGIIHNKKTSILKNNVALNSGLSFDLFLEQALIKANISKNEFLDIFLFKTLEFRENYSEKRFDLYDLYRYRPLILQSEIDKNTLRKAAEYSFQYMEKSITNNLLNYKYSLKQKSYQMAVENEEVLRCLASLWISAKASNFFSNTEFSRKLNFHFMKILKLFDYSSENDSSFIRINNIVDIGSNGFLLLFAKELKSQNEINKLFTFIRKSIDSDNKKLIPIFSPTFVLTDKTHDAELFFPGIALYALSEICNENNQEDILAIASYVFPYYFDLFKAEKDGLKMAVWMASAYSKFYEITLINEYRNFVYQICNRFLESQNVNCSYPDIVGYLNSPNVITTAVGIETILEGYKLAKNEDLPLAEKYKKSIMLALRFLLQFQITVENSFDKNAFGGFYNEIASTDIRIDVLQHSLGAILKAIEYFNE